jgi:hypothetical protein
MHKLSDIVVVNVKADPMHAYRTKYAVMVDATPDEVRRFAESHPKVFVFIFLVMPPWKIADIPEPFTFEGRAYDHVVMPYYLGNFEAAFRERFIPEFIEWSFNMPLSECDKIEVD